MKNNNMIVMALVAVVALGIGFFSGMKYQQSQRSALSQQYGAGQGARGAGRFGGGAAGARGGFRPVTGDIISSDDTSVTVKLMDGSSKIVMISDKTQINKAAKAQKSDLAVGQTVAVFGTDNSDGSVNAQSIQLNPQLMRNRVPTTTK